MVPRTSVQVQSRSKLMSAMYCITHKIIRLSQVICANGSRKLFRFRVRQFSGLKYYFTWEITPFRNLFSVCPGFWHTGGPFQAGFTVSISILTKLFSKLAKVGLILFVGRYVNSVTVLLRLKVVNKLMQHQCFWHMVLWVILYIDVRGKLFNVTIKMYFMGKLYLV